MNYGDGDNLSLGDETVWFRVSAPPCNHTRGELCGTPSRFDLLTQHRDDD